MEIKVKTIDALSNFENFEFAGQDITLLEIDEFSLFLIILDDDSSQAEIKVYDDRKEAELEFKELVDMAMGH